MKIRQPHFLLWVATILLVCIITLPRLIQHGMFMDGELYASVAHNLAHGLGSFWFPTFNEYVHPLFDQQPPLTFGIQALFFKIFGDSMYVERVYDFIFCLIHVLLIHLIWKEIFKQSELKKLSWLPIVLWFSIPVCSWDFVNNMEEITMGVFVQLSILFAVKNIFSNKNNFIYAFLSGVSLITAWLCKGFPGLFPLTTFFFAFIFFKQFNIKKAALNYAAMLLSIATIIIALYFYSPANKCLSTYLNNRVLNSIKNVAETDNRFYMWGRLLSELIIPFLIVAIVLGIKWIKKEKITFDKKGSVFFISLGLSGVLPLIVTLEQRGFYMVTALPCFAISLSILIAPTINEWINLFHQQITKWLKPLCAAGFITLTLSLFFLHNEFTRSENALSDIYQFGKIIPQHSTIGVSNDLYEDWGTGCYFQRFYFIAVDGCTKDWNTHPFVMINKSTAANYISFLKAYKKIDLYTQQFDLYQHK
ncbi:MAG: hypothetical protein RI955_894 [Bacteroidota bacterium]